MIDIGVKPTGKVEFPVQAIDGIVKRIKILENNTFKEIVEIARKKFNYKPGCSLSHNIIGSMGRGKDGYKIKGISDESTFAELTKIISLDVGRFFIFKK